MKIKSTLKLVFITLIFSNLVLNSCGNREDTVSCFPEQHINVTLNLNFPRYANDLNNQGWTYIDEQQSGTRGLILIRKGIAPNYDFIIFDRNAPHICPTSKSTLEVKNDIKIVCPEDGAEWMLNGHPTKISSLPPKKYLSSYNPASNTISIYY